MERNNGNSNEETKSVLDGIHALYIEGKISLAKHKQRMVPAGMRRRNIIQTLTD